MKIVWIGCHEEGIPAFKATLVNRKNVAAFITLDDDLFEKRSAGSREYETYCREYGVSYFTVNSIKSEEAYKIVSELKPDLLVVLGWSEILPERLLEIPSIGTVGTHAALLPHNRGSAPINWALIHGEKTTGNTMMWLEKEVDAGRIIDQIEFPVSIYDTCKTLYEKVADTNAVMLERLIAKLEAGVMPEILKKNETDEPLLPRRRPKDGLIDWKQTGQRIYDFVRALTVPYPGAYSYLGGKRWLIWALSILPIGSKCNGVIPGEIIGNAYGFSCAANGILVGTQTEILLVTEMEDEDGRKYTGRELNELGLEGVFQNE